MKPPTFREACCERLGLAPSAFEDAVLWRCLFGHALVVAHLFRRGYFDADRDLIRAVADCTTFDAVAREVNADRYRRPPAGLWRGLLRVRLSARRLLDLAAEVLD